VSAVVQVPPALLPPRVGGLGEITSDNFRPAAFVVGALFVAFTVYNWLTFRPGVREPMCLYDLGLVVLGFGQYAIARRVSLSPTGVHIFAAVLSFAVLGNILLGALLHTSPLFTFYVAVLLIASAGSVLSIAWALAIGCIGYIAIPFTQNPWLLGTVIISAATSSVIASSSTCRSRRPLAFDFSSLTS